MKKPLIITMVILVLLLFAACGGQPSEVEELIEEPTQEPTEVPTEAPVQTHIEEAIVAGSPLDAVIEGDVYTNSYFGISVTVMPGSIWYTKERLNSTFAIRKVMIDINNVPASDILPLCACYTSNETNQTVSMSMMFSTESIPANDTQASNCVKSSAKGLDEAYGAVTEYTLPKATEFDGHSAFVFDMQSDFGESIWNQSIVWVEVEEGMLVISYSYNTDEQREAAINSMDSITFSK